VGQVNDITTTEEFTMAVMDFPTPEEVPDWMKTVLIHNKDRMMFLPAVLIGDDQSEVAEMALDGGGSVATDTDGHVFIDTEWMQTVDPRFEVIARTIKTQLMVDRPWMFTQEETDADEDGISTGHRE
jgi:hypothetical protein